ncbi:TLC domain containing protein, putative [Angomonas deanei]|uniref:TLC domain containing protein, putative n=1 Tax=Angomonas deanei TaxID=59799 RepID=A0A7G2CBK3_9TRYP|nr:TLC domain containing protein, putative [Angomonas deanei]
MTDCVRDPSLCHATYQQALQVLQSPLKEHTRWSGWGGLGLDFPLIQLVLPSLLWGMCLYFIKIVIQRPIEHISTVFCSISPVKYPKRTRKLKNQCWLLFFYVCSSIFGFLLIHRERYFRFPVSIKDTSGAAASLYDGHPQAPSALILLYYNYEIGFYICEIFTVFINISWGKYLMCGRRMSTIFEVATHHTFTLFLLFFSHMGYFHRVGSYVLFLHDTSDVLLCISKIAVYTRRPERVVNLTFFVFVLSFVFLRLFCLPMLMFSSLTVGTRLTPCTINYWSLFVVIHGFIQLIHVYWFVLIMKIAARAVTKPPSARSRDIRSSSSETEEESEDEATEKYGTVEDHHPTATAASDHTNSNRNGKERGADTPVHHSREGSPQREAAEELYSARPEPGRRGANRRFVAPIPDMNDAKIDSLASLSRVKKRKSQV